MQIKPIDLLFFNSLFLSRLCDQVVLFMVPLVIYQLTGSVALSGLAFFIESLPRFISFPVSGILCDFISPLLILTRSQKIRFIIIPLGLIGYWLFNSVFWLIAISALSGVATSFGMMAREMILPQVFNQGRFEKILSYTSLCDQLGMVIGPVISAFLLTFTSWQIVMLFTAVLFLVSDVSVHLWVKLKQAKIVSLNNGKINLFASTQTALHQILTSRGLIAAIVLAFSINLMLGATLATMAPIYTGTFEQSEFSYGILQTLGALMTIIVISCIAHINIPLAVLGFVGFSAMAIGAVITSFATDHIIYLIGFLLIIGFDKMFNIYVRALRAKIIPAKNLGKTTGFIVLFNNLSQPLAGLFIALAAGVISLQMSLFILNGLAILLGIGILLYLRLHTSAD